MLASLHMPLILLIWLALSQLTPLGGVASQANDGRRDIRPEEVAGLIAAATAIAIGTSAVSRRSKTRKLKTKRKPKVQSKSGRVMHDIARGAPKIQPQPSTFGSVPATVASSADGLKREEIIVAAAAPKTVVVSQMFSVTVAIHSPNTSSEISPIDDTIEFVSKPGWVCADLVDREISFRSSSRIQQGCGHRVLNGYVDDCRRLRCR